MPDPSDPSDDNGTALQGYESRYRALFSEARIDIEEFLTKGVVTRAGKLSVDTGQHFYDDRLPGYFGGDLDASVVLVHLNPKSSGPPPKNEEYIRTFEEWFYRCRHFGDLEYGPSAPRTHVSPFDHKQVRFLKPFGVMDFVEERKGHPEDRSGNLPRANVGRASEEPGH
jgi:hypothetical protein